MKQNDTTAASSPGDRRFPPTHWSVVQMLRDGDEEGRRTALETLCRTYWYPLYVYIRGHGCSHHQAEECTQDFLARLLASEALGRVRQERGRFRAYLLASLRNFLANEWHRAHAAKRGGDSTLLPLEMDGAEQRYTLEPADPELTPEQAFDRNWALGLLTGAEAELRREYEQSGRGTLFRTLEPLLWRQADEETHAILAGQLGMKPHAFTVALQRLRHRFAGRLRQHVARTVGNEQELEEELRYLVTALRGAPLSGIPPSSGC